MSLKAKFALVIAVTLLNVVFPPASSAQISLQVSNSSSPAEISSSRTAVTATPYSSGAGLLVSGSLVASVTLATTNLIITYPGPITSSLTVPSGDPIRIEGATGLFASVTTASITINHAARTLTVQLPGGAVSSSGSFRIVGVRIDANGLIAPVVAQFSLSSSSNNYFLSAVPAVVITSLAPGISSLVVGARTTALPNLGTFSLYTDGLVLDPSASMTITEGGASLWRTAAQSTTSAASTVPNATLVRLSCSGIPNGLTLSLALASTTSSLSLSMSRTTLTSSANSVTFTPNATSMTSTESFQVDFMATAIPTTFAPGDVTCTASMSPVGANLDSNNQPSAADGYPRFASVEVGPVTIGYISSGTATPLLRKWASSTLPVTWRLNPAKESNITGSRELSDVIRAAFQRWSNVETAVLSFQEGPTDSATDAGFDQINRISAVPTNYTSGAPALTILYSFNSAGADQFGRTVEFPGQIVEADIIFNPSALFSTDAATPSNRYDLESVAVHEIGHLLGLDHTALSSAAMFATTQPGVNYGRTLSSDDVINISKLYPASTFFTSRGAVSGVVRTSSGEAAFGAHVVVMDGAGRPVASTFTDPSGNYQVVGLEPGEYTTYVEPLDGPVTSSSISNLSADYPGSAVNTNFSTRFGAVTATAPALTITKTGGDNQSGNIGEPLSTPLEVLVANASGSPVPGTTVTFSGTSGGATIVPFRATTDTQGKARATAYLGIGRTQSFTAFAGSLKTTFTATVRPPVLTSISSNTGTRGTSVNVTLSGKNFVKNATTVTVSGAGVGVTAVNVTNPTSLAVTFTIDAVATLGARNVTVTTPGATTNAVTFTINPPPPTLSSINPAAGAPGTAVAVTLTGTNFVAGATLNVSGAGVTVSSVSVVSGTSITATLTIDAAATPGARNVTVTTAGGTSNVVTFTINPPPTLSSTNPSSLAVTITSSVPVGGYQVTINYDKNIVNLSASNLSGGAAPFSRTEVGTFATNIDNATGTVGLSQFTTSNPRTGTFTVANLVFTPVGVGTTALTLSNVSVSDPEGNSLPNGGLAITSTSLTANQAAISPASTLRGTAVPVTLTGTNFIAGATVNVSGSGVTVGSVNVVSSTSITATLTVDASATLGTRDVTVTTAGGTTRAAAFTIYP